MRITKLDEFKQAIKFYLHHKSKVEAFGLYHLDDRTARQMYCLGKKLHAEVGEHFPALK